MKILNRSVLICGSVFLVVTIIYNREKLDWNQFLTFKTSEIRHKPYTLTFYKQIRDTFFNSRRDLCPTLQEWGGIYIMMEFIDKNQKKLLAKKGGKYLVCMAKGIAPSETGCLVYSFGINFEWSFDERAEEEGCEVFSFDHSKGWPNHHHSFHIIFRDKGLWKEDVIIHQKNQLWKMVKFSTLLEKNNHTKRIIDILKIDIEENEHEAIPEMVKSGTLRNVRQILLQYHNLGKYSLEEYYSTFGVLHSYGFISVYVEEWPHPACAKQDNGRNYEVYCFIFTFINIRFLGK